jgi:hypothetical protein
MLCLLLAVAVVAAVAAVVAVVAVVVAAAAAAVAAATVAVAAVVVHLLLEVAKARVALPGPRSTTLGLAPSTCGRAHPWVLLHPVHRSTGLPSSLHHSMALQHSRRGPRSHLPWHLSCCLKLPFTAIVLDTVVYGVGPTVPRQLLWHDGALLPQPLH